MESTITINEGAVSTMTDTALAQAVVDARAELARVKELAELAETAFKASGLESVTLDDGTKVAIVEQSRRAIDNAKLKAVLPTGQFQRVTKRVGDLKLIDGGIDANWLDADLVGEAIKTTTVRALKGYATQAIKPQKLRPNGRGFCLDGHKCRKSARGREKRS